MVVARASEHDEREQLADALESLGFWWPSARAETFQLALNNRSAASRLSVPNLNARSTALQ